MHIHDGTHTHTSTHIHTSKHAHRVTNTHIQADTHRHRQKHRHTTTTTYNETHNDTHIETLTQQQNRTQLLQTRHYTYYDADKRSTTNAQVVYKLAKTLIKTKMLTKRFVILCMYVSLFVGVFQFLHVIVYDYV